MSRAHLLMLLALAAIWGASFMFIKVGVRELEPATLVFFRVGLAALTLLPLARISALRGHWRDVAVVGVLNSAVPFWLLSFGETRIDSGLAAIIQACAPLFTALLALRFDSTQRVAGLRLAGLLVGFAGVTLLVGNQRGGELVGAVAVVLTALCYAGGVLYAGRRLAGVSARAVSLGSMLAATAVSAPLGLAQLPGEPPSLEVAGSVLALGVIGTGLAYILYFAVIAGAGASRAILITYLVPGAALVYGAAVLDEPITATALAGLALILAGVALASRVRR